MSKNIKQKGKISITSFLRDFNDGDKVCLVAEPAYQKGMYYPRFHGKAGIVVGKKGNCYEVQIKDYLGSIQNIDSAKVILSPFWVKKIPRNKSDIELILSF